MSFQITVGAGLNRPQGRRVEVNDIEGLARALSEQPEAVEAWWAPHVWQGDARDSDAWEGSCAIALDMDREAHAPLSSEFAEQLDEAARGGSLPGSIFHRTPAGARVVFVLDMPCTDATAFGRAADGAAQVLQEQLRELSLDGIAVDPKPHRDLARLYFTPNSIAKGVKRSAAVHVMRRAPYTVAELAEWRSVEPPIPIQTAVPRALPGGDAVERARRYLSRVPPAVEGEQGDNLTYRLAAVLVVDFCLAADDAFALLLEWNRTCAPPWSDKDLREKVERARKYGKKPPGTKLAAPPRASEPVPGSAPQAAAEPERRAIPLVRACDAVERPVEWVIENFLAKGELTDLSGDPGVGKGGITASWAAHITREDPNATVIFFATEDPLGRVKARLRAEGADLTRVLLLDITRTDSSVILPADTALVEELVIKHRAALLILDPALEFMEAELDSHKQQDVARFMGPLLAIAQRTGAALLTVRHLNKSGGSSALYRASGSIGFTGKVRIALLASKDGESGQRALAVTKNNLGKDKHTVAYDIVSKGDASVVAWGEVLATSADELVNQEPRKRSGPPPARLDAARDAVVGMLSNGPMQVDDVLRCAKAEGIGRTTVYEAARALRVEKVTVRMRSGWRLPSDGTPDGLSVNSESQLRTTPDNSGNRVKEA